LVENAIKYTPDGWITVSVKADDRNAQIIVKDTGLGMPREELSHIFQKFYRVDNRDTREIGGTGLGLYLVKKRVEAMNGRIWAESEPGKGSTFFVSFPRISSEVYRQQRFALDNQTMMQRPQNKPSSTQDALVQQIIASATPNPATPTTQVTPEEPVEDAAQVAHARAVAENPNVVAPPQPVMPTPVKRDAAAVQKPADSTQNPASPAAM
jgi:hypothetical protein